MDMAGIYIAVSEDTLDGLLKGTADLQDLYAEGYPTLNLEDWWQAVHFLLCGEIDNGRPPMGYVVPMLNSQRLECDLQFGAYYLRSGQVAAAADYLAGLTEEGLCRLYRFDSFVKKNVYPVYPEDDEREVFRHLLHSLRDLTAFYTAAAQRGDGLVFYNDQTDLFEMVW